MRVDKLTEKFKVIIADVSDLRKPLFPIVLHAANEILCFVSVIYFGERYLHAAHVIVDGESVG